MNRQLKFNMRGGLTTYSLDCSECNFRIAKQSWRIGMVQPSHERLIRIIWLPYYRPEESHNSPEPSQEIDVEILEMMMKVELARQARNLVDTMAVG